MPALKLKFYKSYLWDYLRLKDYQEILSLAGSEVGAELEYEDMISGIVDGAQFDLANVKFGDCSVEYRQMMAAVDG